MAYVEYPFPPEAQRAIAAARQLGAKVDTWEVNGRYFAALSNLTTPVRDRLLAMGFGAYSVNTVVWRGGPSPAPKKP